MAIRLSIMIQLVVIKYFSIILGPSENIRFPQFKNANKV